MNDTLTPGLCSSHKYPCESSWLEPGQQDDPLSVWLHLWTDACRSDTVSHPPHGSKTVDTQAQRGNVLLRVQKPAWSTKNDQGFIYWSCALQQEAVTSLSLLTSTSLLHSLSLQKWNQASVSFIMLPHLTWASELGDLCLRKCHTSVDTNKDYKI